MAKLRFRRAGRRSLQGRKVSAVYKATEGIPRRATRRPKFRLVPSSSSPGGGECCSQWIRSRRGGDKSVNSWVEETFKNLSFEGFCQLCPVGGARVGKTLHR